MLGKGGEETKKKKINHSLIVWGLSSERELELLAAPTMMIPGGVRLWGDRKAHDRIWPVMSRGTFPLGLWFLCPGPRLG